VREDRSQVIRSGMLCIVFRATIDDVVSDIVRFRSASLGDVKDS
jgi:hypothetical protein